MLRAWMETVRPLHRARHYIEVGGSCMQTEVVKREMQSQSTASDSNRVHCTEHVTTLRSVVVVARLDRNRSYRNLRRHYIEVGGCCCAPGIVLATAFGLARRRPPAAGCSHTPKTTSGWNVEKALTITAFRLFIAFSTFRKSNRKV